MLKSYNTAISKHEFLSKFWNCPLVFCSHLLYYAIQALCDIFQCSLCIQRMWIPVSKNKFIWGTNYIQLHYWLRRTSGAIFFLEIRISMAADVGLWDSMTVMMQFLLLLGRCLCDLFWYRYLHISSISPISVVGIWAYIHVAIIRHQWVSIS